MRICILVLFIFSMLYARNIRTPHEVYQFMKSSPTQYNVKVLDSAIVYNYDALVLAPGLMLSDSGNLVEIPMQKSAEGYFHKAKDAFYKRNYSKAHDFYMKAYNIDTSYTPALTYAANCLFIQEKYSKAIALLNKSIQKNYYSYQAHWFLADCLFSLNTEKEKAFKHLIIANILNRNKKLLLESLEGFSVSLYKGWKQVDFEPQCLIKKAEDGIELHVNVAWMGWAISRAAWMYEAGYIDEYDKKDVITAHKEALLGYLVTSKCKDKVSKNAKQATEAGYNVEFLLYEYLIKRNPTLSYQLDIKSIEGIASYVFDYRIKK